MGTSARTLLDGTDADETTASLVSAYAYHHTVVIWAGAVLNRLEGFALLTLSEELESAIDDSLEAAQQIATRVAELGGSLPWDPTEMVELSPLDPPRMPADLSDPKAILGYALEQQRKLIAVYASLLESTRGTDDLTHRLVVGLLQREVTREDEMEGALV